MRALVLGGGGITGIAWELGLIAGLRRTGVDLTAADLIIGTSAGAYVGALIAGGVDLDEAAEDAAAVELEFSPRVDPALLAQGFALLTDDRLGARQKRARLGALARSAPVGDDRTHVARFDDNLPVREWPTAPRLLITAVDTETGDLAAWDAAARVPLAEAVAASCALPGLLPPVRIGGRHYMDGGVRSNTNADLAAGADSVIILTPSTSMFRTSPEEELAMLGVPRGLIVTPDDRARAAIGRNILDPGRRGPALTAGMNQAPSVAAAVAANWA